MRTQSIVERLEFVSKRVPNLKFTPPTQLKPGDDQGCFMSCDMFYIEIKLDQTCQYVKDVVISHGNSQEVLSCTVLKNVLSEQDYETFAKHLLGLHSIYQINTSDKKVKQRAYPSLTALEQDLTLLSNYQRNSINDCHNLVHKSPIGVMEPRKGGLPVRLYFFISPYDLVDHQKKKFIDLTISDIIEKNLGLSATVEIEGSQNPQSTCKLQVKSLISTQQTSTGKSLPAFAPLNNQNSEKLPAQFVLKLSQPMALATASINQLIELAERMGEPTSIKEYFASLTASKEYLISLIAKQPLDSLKGSSLGSRLETSNTINGELHDNKKQTYCIQLKADIHTYQIVNSHFDKQDGVFVERIPFTHPTSIPSILMILRQQALFNFIIGSCIRPSKNKNGTPNNNSEYIDDGSDANMFEVTPINLTSICVSFEHPSKESLATVEIDLRDINELKCQLHARDMNSLCSDSCASKIIQKCWSIPVTLRAVLQKCNETRVALLEEANKKREKEFENLLASNVTTQDSAFQSQLSNQETFSAKSRQTPMSTDDHNISHKISLNLANRNNDLHANSSGLSNESSDKHQALRTDGVPDQLNKSNYLKRFSCQPRVNAHSQLCPPSNLSRVINKLNNKEAQRKATMTKQSNTILMSMLSDVPASAVGQNSSPKAIKRSRTSVNKKNAATNSNQVGIDNVNKAFASDSSSSNKTDSSKGSPNNIKTKYQRTSIDQFAIKQGSSGLKLTVKKTKLSGNSSVSTSSSPLSTSSTSAPLSSSASSTSSSNLTSSSVSASAPPLTSNTLPVPASSTSTSATTSSSSSTSSSSTAISTSSASTNLTPLSASSSLSSSTAPPNSTQNTSSVEASKLFNTAAASGIKYKIPKISKTQVTAQSSGTHQASSSDSNPNPNTEHSNNNGNNNNNNNNDPSSSVSSTNIPSSTTSKRANLTPFGRGNNQQRNSVTSSTHPFGRPTINPLSFTTNKASSSTTPNNRISSSNNNNNNIPNFQLSRPESFHIALPNQPQQKLPQMRTLFNSSLPAPAISYNLVPNAGPPTPSVQYVPAIGTFSVAGGSKPAMAVMAPASVELSVSSVVAPSSGAASMSQPVSTNYQPMMGNSSVQQRQHQSLQQTSAMKSNTSCDTSTQPSVESSMRGSRGGPQMSVSSSSDSSTPTNSAAAATASGEAASLSTPSSPTDCNQVDSLPPPALIPIDSLDDTNKSAVASMAIASPSSEQADDGASDRLSIVDTNESNLADTNSVSADTPRPSDVDSPAQLIDLVMEVAQEGMLQQK